MKDRTYYTPSGIADKIANNDHSYAEHKDEFVNPELGKVVEGINTKQDYKEHIQNTMENKETHYFSSINNRDYYYNQSTNTIIAANPDHPKGYGGTCFRPEEREEQLIEKINKDSKIDPTLELPENGVSSLTDLPQGGYNALYPERMEDIYKDSSNESHLEENELPINLEQNLEITEMESEQEMDDDLPENLQETYEASEISDQQDIENDLPDNLDSFESTDLSNEQNDISDTTESIEMADHSDSVDMSDNSAGDVGESFDGPDTGDSSDGPDL